MSRVRKTAARQGGSGKVYDLERRRAARRQAERGDPGGQESAAERARRIEELKAQIAAGEYQPDPREIAKKMLEQGF
jgi:anti-sigma28 factor (negative regulator of flagellin synthesis)